LRASLDPPVTGEDAMIQNKNVSMQEKKIEGRFCPSRPRDDRLGKAGTASRAVVVRKNRVGTCVETLAIFEKSPASSNRRFCGRATVSALEAPRRSIGKSRHRVPRGRCSQESCQHLCRDIRNLRQVSCEFKPSNWRVGHRPRPSRPHDDRSGKAGTASPANSFEKIVSAPVSRRS
jgi:hypothetical protein